MLARLSKNLLLDNISTTFVTLPLPSAFWKEYSENDMRMYSKSQSLMIFSLSDTDAVQDYLEKVENLLMQIISLDNFFYIISIFHKTFLSSYLIFI